MPDKIDLQIKNIQTKLELLLKQYASAIKDNARLKKENEEYLATCGDLTQKNNDLLQQVYILKASAGKLEEPEKKEFERKIQKYIQTIEKCMNMLNT